MKLRIYIVDDEVMANQYMIYLLGRIRIEAEVVGQSTNSMKAYSEILACKPDVVFADIDMPVMDGLELAEKLLDKISVKIIFLTSYKDFDFVKRGMRLGAADYVLKNELSEAYLEKLLTKITEELKIDKRNRHVLLEHNVRHFLRSEASPEEDRTYSDRTMQRYGLLYMIRRPVISVRHIDEEDGQKIDCYDLENLEYPDGIKCNAITEMSGGELCNVIQLSILNGASR